MLLRVAPAAQIIQQAVQNVDVRFRGNYTNEKQRGIAGMFRTKNNENNIWRNKQERKLERRALILSCTTL